jgi:hypothetical protein
MDFATKIAAMRPNYLRRTLARIANAREKLAAAASEESAASLIEARLMLHDIAGTAPVMGLAETAAAARAAEDQVLVLLQGDAPQGDLKELLAALDFLYRSANEGLGAP